KRKPTCRGPQPKPAFAHSAKVLSIAAKAVVVRKNKIIRCRSDGRAKASCASAIRPGRCAVLRFAGARLSFKRMMAKTKAMAERAAAAKAGYDSVAEAASEPPSSPPIAGPKVKPRPKDAPIMP